ncbi:SAM-dependent methyltransferase [Pseudoxanthomonas indica]|uniref:Tetrapyrrole (Corrin/Porphyrin) Methylases n=1 Tax=Pseudoxanthomonas indica TaxID=428993 RepID=A0A1T5LX14_9GAMM|nr:SAM-dependent methyltransferase [Pseudoxanthomonas indica]GGD41308.1 hypothetical protein GCM10007235_11690 [Pseudoxanthomonas indica]SKC80413.1 Tetrapyrrole (Corrin/Porphyrin) Methylases [Pseudoxanthomonas indica]
MDVRGSLVCVGTGMMLGAHLGPRARRHIEHADVVFVAVSDPLVELWLQQMHPDVRSLQPLYAEDRSRRDTYEAMVDALLTEVRAGRHVVGAFYGHPGVFARAPHAAIAQARAEGFDAVMEPGISAEDCLYADLGIDPGTFGCQHYEASQFMLFQRRIDPSAYLILWQVGLAGDRSLRRTHTSPAERQLLVDLLATDYPLDHEVIAYEAATLPISQVRREHLILATLAHARLEPHTTLVVPPCRPLQPNLALREKLAALDPGNTASAHPAVAIPSALT